MSLKTVYLPEARSPGVLFAIIGSLWTLLAYWLVLINLAAFFVYGYDKVLAKRSEKRKNVRRVPEKTLLLLAAVGGSLGALLGMKVWRHKTLHGRFRFGVPLMLVLHILVIFGLWLYWNVVLAG